MLKLLTMLFRWFLGFLFFSFSLVAGENILLIQDLGMPGKSYERLTGALVKRGHQVVFVDYSHWPRNHLRIASDTQGLISLTALAEKSWSQFHKKQRRVVIGFGLGGLVAYEMASRSYQGKGERPLDAVVLVNPWLTPYEKYAEWRNRDFFKYALFEGASDFLRDVSREAFVNYWFTLIPERVKGLVLFSAENPFISEDDILTEVLPTNAPQFDVLHLLKAQEEEKAIVNFLAGLPQWATEERFSELVYSAPDQQPIHFFPIAGSEDTWKIAGDLIETSGRPYGYLVTKNSYRNFVLSVKLHYPLGPGNSGVLLHITGKNKVWPECIEVQGRHHDMGKILGVRAEVKVLMDRDVARQERLRSPSDWNQLRVISHEGSLVVWLNGEKITEGKTSLKEGPIALQSEGAPVQFRHLRLTKE